MLNLPQTLFILAIDDDKGRLIPSPALGYGLAGAVLVDLALLGKIGLESDEPSGRTLRLVVLDGTPSGDAILDAELEKMVQTGRPVKVNSWLNALSKKHLRKGIGVSLLREGILTIQDKRFRWVLPYIAQPDGLMVNASAKYWIKLRLRGMVLAAEPADLESLALLRLLRACRLINLIFTKEERKAAGKQVEKLVHAWVSGEPAARILDEIEAAVVRSAPDPGANRSRGA